jgi:glycosyltransferase involved in cell wall biosynthesis
MSQNREIQVNIAIVTYNHERFIAKAIESVLMQETNFDYQLIIGDDSSTDRTVEICKGYENNYPGKIKLIRNETNLGLLRNYKGVLESCNAKYIALLEGDDFWTDANKLQLQFDFLEHNPEIGLVHTNCDLLYESGKIYRDDYQRISNLAKDQYVFDQLLHRNYIRTATVMFRNELYGKYINIEEYIKLDFKTLDYPMWLDLSTLTKFCFLPITTAVYHIHSSSITNSKIYEKTAIFLKSNFEIKNYAFNKYNCSPKLRKSAANNSILEQIKINMYYRKYDSLFELRRRLKILNFKCFVISILSSNRYLINLYTNYLKIRGNLRSIPSFTNFFDVFNVNK